MILLLTGCWLLLSLPNKDTDPQDTSWWTDADTDADADTDVDDEYFDAYVWGLDFYGGYDGQDLIPYGIGGDIEQPPYVEVVLYEERWFETQNDLHTCRATFQVDMTREDDLGWAGTMWFGAEIELTYIPDAKPDDCTDMNPVKWGTNTLEEVMEGRRMGVGMAPLSSEMEQDLKEAVNSGNGNWSQDYAPYLLGFYIADATAGNFYGQELGWGYFTHLDEDNVLVYGDDGEALSYEIDELSGVPEGQSILLQGSSYYLQYVDGTLLP